MIEAITNSFQALRNTSRATAASAGCDSGRMIDHRLWRRDAPSTAAASSNSRGIVWKKPRRTQIASGSEWTQ